MFGFKNLLALVGLVVVGFVVAGYYLGWYSIGAEADSQGHQELKIQINATQVEKDVSRGEKQVLQVLNNGQQTQPSSTAPPPSAPVQPPAPLPGPPPSVPLQPNEGSRPLLPLPPQSSDGPRPMPVPVRPGETNPTVPASQWLPAVPPPPQSSGGFTFDMPR
jgi:hypothetical protein